MASMQHGIDRDSTLLLAVLRIFPEMMDLLAGEKDQSHLHGFYCRVSGRCLVVAGQIDRVKAVINPANPLIQDLLGRLQDLVKDPAQETLLISATNNNHSILMSLHLDWVEATRQGPGTKLDFIRQHIDFGSPDQRDEFLMLLKNSSEKISSQFPEDTSQLVGDYSPPSPKRSDPPYPAVWKAGRLVFKALLASTKCACEQSHDYGARLCLSTYRNSGLNKGFDFDMLLAREQACENYWQEAKIYTSESSVRHASGNKEDQYDPANIHKSKSKVKFALGRNEEQYNQGEKELESVKSLCELVEKSKERPMLRLNLVIKGDQLRIQQTKLQRSKLRIDKSKLPVSLEDFISSSLGTLTDKTKRILAVFLSHAVLHLHGTPWLPSTWGPASIMFFKAASYIPLKPYIQTQFVPEHEFPDELKKDDHMSLSLHCLVTLGIVLMELHLSQPFAALAAQSNVDFSSTMDANGKYFAALDVFEQRKSDITEKSRFAIDKCFDEQIGLSPNGQDLTLIELKKVIYEEIVQPLEDELHQGFGTSIVIEDLDEIAQNLDFGGFGQMIQNQKGTAHVFQKDDPKAQEIPNLPKPFQHPQTFHHSRAPSIISPKKNESNTWLNRLTKHIFRSVVPSPTTSKHWGVQTSSYAKGASVQRFFDDQSRPENILDQARDDYLSWKETFVDVREKFLDGGSDYVPVKIAILDTGIDLKHTDCRAFQDHIRVKKCYVPGSSQEIHDLSGHGTHVAGLFFDYAPDSLFYIAKIADHEPCHPKIIAQAVNDAVNVWNVDIISMSFGFHQRQVEGYSILEQALREAQHKDVLLFAAASNDGANKRRAYPARQEGVICIHSTDTFGAPSKFNPTPISGENFATIGEAVTSTWPVHLCDEANKFCLECKSGTSFATPIAAGIAAFLLQYARMKLPSDAAKDLKRSERLRAVLRDLSVEIREYHYIALPGNLFGSDEDYARERILNVLRNS